MLAFSNDYYGMIFRATQSVELFCAYIKNIDSSVDLLIVDIGLPDGDGINLYQELQKNGRIPAIFLTAKDDEKDMLKAFDIGADDYVVKPFSIKVLL